MRLLLLALFLQTILPSMVFADMPSSRVYVCRFSDDFTGLLSVRMKEYFDSASSTRLGKIDLIQNSTIVKSTATKVYQLPLSDAQSFMQIWYAKDVRVDAQISYVSHLSFSAAYVTELERKALDCIFLRD